MTKNVDDIILIANDCKSGVDDILRNCKNCRKKMQGLKHRLRK